MRIQTTGGSGGGAPTDGTFIVVSLSGSLTNERRLQGTANRITLTDGGANGDLTLDVGSDVALDSDLPVGANPTASVGLSAVNGAAATFLRSDGAPALSQAIVPTWTGVHIFTPGARSSGVAPYFTINAPADTGLTASTEAIGVSFVGATRTHATGAITQQREFVFAAPTYAFVGASTVSRAATVSIPAAPTAGSNATLTQKCALLIEAGGVIIGDSTIFGSGLSGFPILIIGNVDGNADGPLYIKGRSDINTIASGLTLDAASMSGKKFSIFSTGTGAGIGANNLAIFDSSAGIYRWIMNTSGFVTQKGRDAATNTVSAILTIGHNSSGTPAANYGGSLAFQLKSSTTEDIDAGAIAAVWSTATHASRTSDFVFSLVNNTSGPTETFRLVGAGGSIYASSVALTTAGGLWHDSTQKTFSAFVDGVQQQLVGTLFTKTADTTVGGTTTETSLIGTGTGTATLPANFFVVGKTLRVRAGGHFSTDAVTPATLNIRLRLGGISGTIILATGDKTPAGAVTQDFWEVDITLTCRTTGATGTVMANGNFYHGDDSTNVLYEWEMTNTAAVTVDTTASLAVVLSADWGGTDADDTITATVLTIEALN